MSYARFGWQDSDVYLYGSFGLDSARMITCCGCLLGDTWEFPTKELIFAHLEEHRKAGHTVPQAAIDGIREDDWVQ